MTRRSPLFRPARVDVVVSNRTGRVYRRFCISEEYDALFGRLASSTRKLEFGVVVDWHDLYTWHIVAERGAPMPDIPPCAVALGGVMGILEPSL